jgi:uncharacterized membrane-anchored protein YhcB (DUF1043 family)
MTSQERLEILLRQVVRENQALKTLQEQAANHKGQLDYPTWIQLVEERLATAEMLLLLAQEREAMWRHASQTSSTPLAPSLAQLPLTPDVLQSSNACERKT